MIQHRIRETDKKCTSARMGFTLVEFAISLGLVAVITTIAVPEAVKYHYSTELDTAVTQTVQALGVAQSYARNGKNASSWGMQVPLGIVFQGESFSSRDTSHDVSFPVPSSVTVSGVLEVYFTSPYGVPHTDGIIVFTSTSGEQKAMKIHKNGLVEVIPYEKSSSSSTSSATSLVSSNAVSSTQSQQSSTTSSNANSSASSTSGGASSSLLSSMISSSTSAVSSIASSAVNPSSLSSSSAEASSTSSSTSSSPSFPSSFVSSSSSNSSQIQTGLTWNTQNVSVLLLDSTSQGSLNISGNGNLQITNTNGRVAINSNHAQAMKLSGNGTANATASRFDIVGNPGVSISGNAKVNGTIVSSAPVMADPLVSVPVLTPPSQAYAAVNYSGNQVVTLSPGAYVGGIKVGGNARVILNPGIYYLQGGGLSISGNASITGQGVLIYNAPATENDIIKISGNGNLTLSPMATGTFAGISLFQSRASALGVEISWEDDLVWNGSINIDGVVYLPTANLKISGNGNVNLQCLTASRFILNGLILSGNAQFRVQ